MRANNYGWRSRDMVKAVYFALTEHVQQRVKSNGSRSTVVARFRQFVKFARDHNARRLEFVTPELVQAYGRELADRVDNGEMSARYAQNLVSAVNTAMRAVTREQWQSVSPRGCGIASRRNVRTVAPPSVQTAREAIADMRNNGMERQAAIAELALELGLRSREASCLDARTALAQARESGAVTISGGTKGGRTRTVPITRPEAIQALERAANVQGKARSMIPADKSWKQWMEGDLRKGREALAERSGARGYHDLRATYACARYEALTGRRAPVVAGRREVDKTTDRAARMQIAHELGHGRTDVVVSYIGSAR